MNVQTACQTVLAQYIIPHNEAQTDWTGTLRVCDKIEKCKNV